MKAIIGLSFIIIAGFLLYEAIAGHAVDIVSAIRNGIPDTTTSSSTSSSTNSTQSNGGGRPVGIVGGQVQGTS